MTLLLLLMLSYLAAGCLHPPTHTRSALRTKGGTSSMWLHCCRTHTRPRSLRLMSAGGGAGSQGENTHTALPRSE